MNKVLDCDESELERAKRLQKLFRNRGLYYI